MDITLLTLNTWGAPYSKHRRARMHLIGERVAGMQPDIVFFQEAFLEEDRDALLAILTECGYAHFHHYGSGVVGSGLLTISKHPIVDVAFLRYRMAGKPLMLQHGDYYAGKGVGLARINLNGITLDAYNIHPHAQYIMDDDNPYAIYTDTNLYEASRFIQAHSIENPVVLAGDFNVRPDQPGYQLITALTNLTDAYHALHGEQAVTYAPQNAYVTSPTQCLDYIMLRDGAHITLDTMSCAVVMTDTFDLDTEGAEQFSDHYGVLARLRLATGQPRSQTDPQTRRRHLQSLHGRLSDAVSDTQRHGASHKERAFISGASVFDLWLMSKLINRFAPGVGRFLRTWGIFMSLALMLYSALQAWVNMQARQRTLEALRDEIAITLHEDDAP